MAISENRKKMMDSLSYIWNDIDFIMGVDVHLKTENDVLEMTKYLKENGENNLKSDEVLKKALEIRYNHELKF